LKALNVYGIVGKKGRFVYPYRPVVSAILDNFYLAEAFVVGTRSQVFRPFVDLPKELNASVHPSLVAFNDVLTESANKKDAIEFAKESNDMAVIDTLQNDLSYLEKQAYTMPLTFVGGSKEDLFSGTGKFTASADNG